MKLKHLRLDHFQKKTAFLHLTNGLVNLWRIASLPYTTISNRLLMCHDYSIVCNPLAAPTHHMVTRSKFKTSREPTSVVEAHQQPPWKDATIDEYMALIRNNTWSLAPL